MTFQTSTCTEDSPHLPTEFAPAELASRDELKRQIRRLNEMQLFWDLLNTIPNILMVLNRQRQIVYANDSLFESLGLTPEAIIGQRPGEAFDCVHAFGTVGSCGTTEFCRTCGAVNAILASLEGRQSVQECRIIQRNGGALDLRVWANPLEVDGELFSIFAVQDISHEKRRRALESIFFHDVLNLAGVLAGYIELLADTDHQDTRMRIEQTLQQTSIRLIDEIKTQRDLLAAESGELEAVPVPVSSRRVLDDVINFYAGHEVARERVVQIAPESLDVVLESDPLLLGRVLGNMVKNALEASKPGQAVTLGCHEDGACVAFTVHNPGVMPKPVQLQVFQRSFSTKGHGRGLGTYSMKLLTERYLHGTIAFESVEGQGTMFTAAFPHIFPDPGP